MEAGSRKKQGMMLQKYYSNALVAVCLAAMVILVFWMLYDDTRFPMSVYRVMKYGVVSSQWSLAHLLAIGFMPVYVALMIFGAAFLGVQFSVFLRKLLLDRDAGRS